jgi:MauM/NapG family ferredoxin protein
MKKTPSISWVIIRKIVQGIFLLLFIVIIILNQKANSLEGLAKIPVQLDPLLAFSSSLAGRFLIKGILFSTLIWIFTLIFGRFWCGWICPMGTLLDILHFHSKKRVNIPESFRIGKYFLLGVILISSLFGFQTLVWFDPISIFQRLLITGILPVMDRVFTWLEIVLYPIPFFSNVINKADLLLRPAIFPLQPVRFTNIGWIISIPVIIILLNLFSMRFWCRYLCPLGGLFAFLSRFSIFRRQVDLGKCTCCSQCAQNCPTGTIDQTAGYRSDPAECIFCMNCVEACSFSANEIKPEMPEILHFPYDADRRKLFSSLGYAILGVAFLKLVSSSNRTPIRPPGIMQGSFLARCVRCGACYKICPTNAIQPAPFMDESYGSPELILRIGYCDYSCNSCGLVCPTQAIPVLPLEVKRKTVIGKAIINTNKCIAWAQHQDCIVCEEMCPIPQKAIYLKEETFLSRDGANIRVKLPFVDRELCIGCGICENKCPVVGEAAIRVDPLETNGIS